MLFKVFYSTSSNETSLAIYKIPTYQKYGILISAISIVLLGSFAAVEKKKSKAIKESKEKLRFIYNLYDLSMSILFTKLY